VALDSAKILHGVAWNRTWASMLTDLNWPLVTYVYVYVKCMSLTLYLL